MKIKILFIVDKLSFGGAEKVAIEIAKKLSISKEKEIVLLSLDKRRNVYHSTDMNIIYPHKDVGKFFYFWNYSKLFKIINDVNPDIIHTSMGISDWIIGIYKIINYKKLAISTIHTYQQNRLHKIFLKHRLQFCIQSFLYKRFNKVVCVSEDLNYYMQRKYKLSKSKLTTIHNGIENPSNYPIRDKDKEFQGNLLYIGSIRPVKNLNILVSVISELPDYYNLTLIGDGIQKKEIEEIVRKKGLENRVRFLGFKLNAYREIPNYDLLIIPSLHETFSITALEGLVVGIPTIGTNVGGIKEIFGSELEDLLFDPYNSQELKNKIVNIEQNYFNYINRIQAKRERFLNFSVRNMVNKYERLYEILFNQ